MKNGQEFKHHGCSWQQGGQWTQAEGKKYFKKYIFCHKKNSYCEQRLDSWGVWQFLFAPCYHLNPWNSSCKLLLWVRACLWCACLIKVLNEHSIITPTVSWENHSRFSWMALTHQAWLSARSPANNSPAAMETHCRQGHRGRMSEPEQVPDPPCRQTSPVPSCVAFDLSVHHIMLLLHLPSAAASRERPELCCSLLSLTLLRSSIAWEDGDYQ